MSRCFVCIFSEKYSQPCSSLSLNQSQEIDQLNQHNGFLIGSMIFFYPHCLPWNMAAQKHCLTPPRLLSLKLSYGEMFSVERRAKRN